MQQFIEGGWCILQASLSLYKTWGGLVFFSLAKPQLMTARRTSPPSCYNICASYYIGRRRAPGAPLLGHVVRGHSVLRKVVVVLWTGGVGCSTKTLVGPLLLGNLRRLVIGV